MTPPLARVIEVSTGQAAAFAGMLLAELGVEVIKVEPPDGDPLRRRADEDPADFTFAYLNRRKRSLALDLGARRARAAFRRLVATADALIEDVGPRERQRNGLGVRSLRRAQPDMTTVSISPFGSSGPWAEWEGAEIAIQAAGGIMAGTGYEDSGPLRLPSSVAQHIAGLNGATAAMIGVHSVRSGLERGAHFDISAQETFAAHWARHISQYIYAGSTTRRPPRGMGLQGFPHTALAKDGLVYIMALRADWESLAFFLGLEQFANHEWSDARTRVERWSEIEPHFLASLKSKGRYEWTAAAAERGYTFAPVDDALSVTASPHLAARGFFKEATLPSGLQVNCPTLPFSIKEANGAANRVPALGEDTEAVLSETGTSKTEMFELKRAGLIHLSQ
jgi:crotonobetainyl-CoA:carnitine CoA-transferase CaiB-like acyl-CoA transferase